MAKNTKKPARKQHIGKLYKPRENSRISEQAALDIGPIIERLTRSKTATAKALLEEASNPRSPAHKHFEWDDTKAAHKFRLEQAGEFMRSITIVIQKSKAPVRAFYPVVHRQGERSYEQIEQIVQDVDLTEQLLSRARAALLQWHAQYRMLRELAGLGPVISAIENEPSLREEIEAAHGRMQRTVARENSTRRKRRK